MLSDKVVYSQLWARWPLEALKSLMIYDSLTRLSYVKMVLMIASVTTSIVITIDKG